MKNFFYFSTLALMLTACSSDIELSSTGAGETAKSATESAIGFQVINRNKTRGGDDNTSKLLQNNGHYNFGVFAYKNLSDNTQQTVMDNYLVGYGSDNTQEPKTSVGYSFGDDQTTLTSSRWAYEKLGSSDYNYSGSDGYYKKSDNFYMSNQTTQYLKYWDKSTTSTDFYAYAPYLNGTNEDDIAKFTNKKLVIGKNAIKDGYDDASKYDFLYAHKNVTNTDYEKKVQIDFKRISAMIKIGFYEEIDGYSVQILDLKEGQGGYKGVCAAPAKLESNSYMYGTLYHSASATVDYTENTPTLSITGNSTFTEKKDYLQFNLPNVTKDSISSDKSKPSMSATQYYLIPADQQANVTENPNHTGLTFHVTYKLTSLDGSGETITVHNATVFIPYSAEVEGKTVEYCNWQPNHIYTYIFKITKATSGDTSTPGEDDIDPSDPSPKKDTALSPIIFDGCTVENWVDTDKSEHELK